MLIAIKIIDCDQKFSFIMHSINYLQLVVLNSVHCKNVEIWQF